MERVSGQKRRRSLGTKDLCAGRCSGSATSGSARYPLHQAAGDRKAAGPPGESPRGMRARRIALFQPRSLLRYEIHESSAALARFESRGVAGRGSAGAWLADLCGRWLAEHALFGPPEGLVRERPAPPGQRRPRFAAFLACFSGFGAVLRPPRRWPEGRGVFPENFGIND